MSRKTHGSPLHHTEQPSAWARGALYGGGLSLAAILLAGAFVTPRPKPRPPAAPAFSRIPSRRDR